MRKAGAGSGHGTPPEAPDSDPAREAAIHEIIGLLEEALLRCDGDALHIAAIHIDRALHECNRRLKPSDDKEG